MFKTKYTVSILDSKWNPINIKLKLAVIPRRDEFIFLDGQYYSVLNVVHMVNKKQDIFVIINEIPSQPNK